MDLLSALLNFYINTDLYSPASQVIMLMELVMTALIHGVVTPRLQAVSQQPRSMRWMAVIEIVVFGIL